MENLDYYGKFMESFVENRNIWSKIEILVENPDFGRKSKYLKIKLFKEHKGDLMDQNLTDELPFFIFTVFFISLKLKI